MIFQYGDTITNIVVVQFSEDIQTNMDMKYNLTCTTRGPGSAVVTSGYIGAGLVLNSSYLILKATTWLFRTRKM